MIATELRQRRGIAVRTYTLTGDAVIVHHRALLRRSEMSIPYHQLTDRRFSTRLYSKPWLVITGAALFFAIAMVGLARSTGDAGAVAGGWLYFGIAALTGAGFLWSRRHLSGLAGYGTSLWFWADEPSRPEFEAFLTALLRRRALQLERLRSGRPGSPAAELERLVTLRDRGAISPAEFDTLKARILASDRPGPSINGAA